MTQLEARDQEAFVDYVRAHPEASEEEIARALHADVSWIKQLWRRLAESGVVRGGGSEPWTVLDTLKPVADDSADRA